MTPRRLALLLTLLVPILAACVAREVRSIEAGQAASPPRILVFTRTSGWRHDSIPVAIETLFDNTAP